MTAIGETLRRERLRRNLGLEQISRELKISQRLLEAIENDQFEKLPGGVFAKNFVRQYAHLLGLDEDELSAEVQRVVEPPSTIPKFAEESKLNAAHLPRLEPWDGGQSRSSLPALALVVVVMLICSGVYAWWQRQRSIVPSQAAPTAQAPQVSPASPPVGQPESAPPPAQTPSPVPATVDRPAQSAAAAPVPAPPTGSGITESPNAAARISNPNAPVRVEMTADETVWVLARADDKYLFSGTLEASQSRTVEANDKVLLRLGNAGGVTLTLNGKPVGILGPRGQVRTVQFTSGGFQIVAPPKPSLPLEEDIF